jgi:hypothetical protein
MCCNHCPTAETDWVTVQPLLNDALTQLARAESDLFAMRANERTIVAHLACYLNKNFRSLFFRWQIDTDYNRVLMDGKSKKQPLEFLSDALDWLGNQRTQNNDFGNYLGNFTDQQFDLARDALIGEVADLDEVRKKTTPDLIVHGRGCSSLAHNYLALEFKPDWSLKHLSLVDLARMKVFVTNKYCEDSRKLPTYQNSIFIYQQPKARFGAWLFKNGEDHENKKPTFIKFGHQSAASEHNS